MWARFHTESDKYWNAFGFENPYEKLQSVVNIFQINPSRIGSDRTSGAFLNDDVSGKIFLAHDGSLGGRMVGTRDTFLKMFLDGDIVSVTSEDGDRKLILVSSLDDPRLVENIAEFGRVCVSFRGASIRKFRCETLKAATEFAGRMKYKRTGSVEAARRHGVVVNQLAAVLRQAGMEPLSDVKRDLVVRRNGAEVLFEIKRPNSSPYDLYTAVGQLMLNGVAHNKNLKCFVVMEAASLSEEERRLLAAIRIGVITYKYNTKPTFEGIESVLNALQIKT